MNILEKIVVVDLDNTLLEVDSFSLLLSTQFKKKTFRVGFLRILRKLRILSLAKFKEYIGKYIYDNLLEEEKKSFIESLSNHVNQELLNTINVKYKNICRIIILSASLDQYVKPFAHEYGWEGFGSYIDGTSGQFIHLHGDGKINFLNRFFPRDTFLYVYAISDSQSDLSLLKNFNKYDLIKS